MVAVQSAPRQLSSPFAACCTSVAMGSGFSAVKTAAAYATDAADDDRAYRACARLV